MSGEEAASPAQHSPVPPPASCTFPLSSSGGGSERWSRATHRVLEFLIVFAVIGPCPPFFFCNGTTLQSGGANRGLAQQLARRAPGCGVYTEDPWF